MIICMNAFHDAAQFFNVNNLLIVECSEIANAQTEIYYVPKKAAMKSTMLVEK